MKLMKPMNAKVGLAVGAGLAYLVARTLSALLAGIPAADVVTFAVAVGICVLMTVVGSLQPIRRALKLDPVRVLKAD